MHDPGRSAKARSGTPGRRVRSSLCRLLQVKEIGGGRRISSAHPGNIIDYRVEVTRPDDPVMAGIGNFDYRSEQ